MNNFTKENLSKYYDLATIPSSNSTHFDEFERKLFGKNWNMELYNFLDSVYKKPNGKELFIDFVLSGKYKTESTAQPKSEAYGKSKKQPIQVDYAQEIAQRTGTRKEYVQKFLDDNKIDPLTLLQGIGSKRIQLGDFLDAFTDKRMVGDFLKKYNLDGDGSSVWKANPKNTQESLSEMIRRVLKEESYDKITQEEVDTFYKNFYTAMNNLEIIQKLTKNDKFRIYIRKMDEIADAIIEITG
jgi:hypothetical protein